jgi:hypothetical protein
VDEEIAWPLLAPWVIDFSALAKSMSRALYPGVAAFAIFEVKRPSRCARNSSAMP